MAKKKETEEEPAEIAEEAAPAAVETRTCANAACGHLITSVVCPYCGA